MKIIAVKRFGIPDSNIILMLSDDMACNPRNIFVCCEEDEERGDLLLLLILLLILLF
jgi:glycosylphosphatidylinositol transamidase (GPIT) subunit GPI8